VEASLGAVSVDGGDEVSARFDELTPLVRGGAFELVAGRERGEPRVIVIGAGGDRGWQDGALDELARAHARIASRFVPGVAARGRGWVALACDATTTLDAILSWSAATHQPPTPYGPAMGLPLIIMEAMRAAHATLDPRTGAPSCMGSFGAHNVLLSDHGRPWVVGFGHNVAASLGPGVRAVRAGAHQAPEVGMGVPATPASDVYVLDLFFRSLLPFVDLLPLARRAIAGDAAPFAPEAARAWNEAQRRLTASLPGERYASIDEVLDVYRGWWSFLGVVPDIDAWIAHIGARRHACAETTTLAIARDGSWFRPPGARRVDLARRKSLRRLLRELASARVREPGRPRAIGELVAAGWPGERLVDGSGSSRVYVAISTLRQLGLGELLQRQADGYRLDPDVPIGMA